MSLEVGTNIKIIDKEDRIVISISKTHKLQETSRGNKILAKTNRFENIGNISGTKFENKELGLNLIISVRAKKAVKPRKARLDDDNED